MPAPRSLWYGQNLGRWLSARQSGSGRRRLRQLLFDTCWSLQCRLPAPDSADVAVFIVGFWRSGTTYLHSLLAALAGFTAPTTEACFRPASFRLLSSPGRRREQRPMDDVQIDAQSAQEDEFPILLLGGPSPYRGFLDSSRLMESLQESLLDTDGHAAGLLSEFLRHVSAESHGRLVCKSPAHLFRIASLRALWPTAAFLYLVRDPVHVYWSNLRMWGRMSAIYGGHTPSEACIAEFVCRSFELAAEAILELYKLPREQMIVVDYEQLVRAPADQCKALLPRLLNRDWTPADSATIAQTCARLSAWPARTAAAPDRRAARAIASFAEAQKMLLATRMT
ncbi:sulfotransferase family protein [Thermaurantiacus sp.]